MKRACNRLTVFCTTSCRHGSVSGFSTSGRPSSSAGVKVPESGGVSGGVSSRLARLEEPASRSGSGLCKVVPWFCDSTPLYSSQYPSLIDSPPPGIRQAKAYHCTPPKPNLNVIQHSPYINSYNSALKFLFTRIKSVRKGLHGLIGRKGSCTRLWSCLPFQSKNR